MSTPPPPSTSNLRRDRHVSVDLDPNHKVEVKKLASGSRDLKGSPLTVAEWLRVTIGDALAKRTVFEKTFVVKGYAQSDGSIRDTPC